MAIEMVGHIWDGTHWVAGKSTSAPAVQPSEYQPRQQAWSQKYKCMMYRCDECGAPNCSAKYRRCYDCYISEQEED